MLREGSDPGSVLRLARDSTGLAAKKVAEELGIAEHTVYKMENGGAVISEERVKAYLDALSRAKMKLGDAATSKGSTGLSEAALEDLRALGITETPKADLDTKLPGYDMYLKEALKAKERELKTKSAIKTLNSKALKEKEYNLDPILDLKVSARYEGETLTYEEAAAAKDAIHGIRDKRKRRALK